jgi:hypothetical protein
MKDNEDSDEENDEEVEAEESSAGDGTNRLAYPWYRIQSGCLQFADVSRLCRVLEYH